MTRAEFESAISLILNGPSGSDSQPPEKEPEVEESDPEARQVS